MPINSFLYPGAKFIPPYTVDNSCRFNDNDTAYMHKTPSSSGSQRTFTFSTWWKQGDLASSSVIFSSGESDGDPNFAIYYNSSQQLNVLYYEGSSLLQLITNAQYRDPSAWMHICVAIDTTQSTNTNRAKIYINGSQVTSLGTATYCNQNVDISINTSSYRMAIGAGVDNGDVADGYAAETVFIDGTAYAASDFGEFDEDTPTVFKPKDVSGLTFGTNGFYLDFEDSANLGNDANGGTDLTEVNLAATDQATDTPTNNFATLNPLDNYYASHTFSEGNCKIVTHSGNMSFNTATIPVSSGKWYVEAKVIDNADSNYHHVGITETTSSATSNWIGVSATHYGLTGYDGKYWRNNSGTSYGVSNTTNDIVGMYIDLDNNKLYFAKNGTVMNSGTGISITAAASTTNGYYLISYGDWENASTATWEVNFGSPTYSVSSSNSDPNGYGSFEYSTTITGDGSSKSFYALCTKNLADYG